LRGITSIRLWQKVGFVCPPRKSHTSKTPDFFFSLCSEIKRSRDRDGRVTLETQPRPPTLDPDNQTGVAHGSCATTCPTRVRPRPHRRLTSPVEPECREHQITRPDRTRCDHRPDLITENHQRGEKGERPAKGRDPGRGGSVRICDRISVDGVGRSRGRG